MSKKAKYFFSKNKKLGKKFIFLTPSILTHFVKGEEEEKIARSMKSICRDQTFTFALNPKKW
jgi:hypothetical protein